MGAANSPAISCRITNSALHMIREGEPVFQGCIDTTWRDVMAVPSIQILEEKLSRALHQRASYASGDFDAKYIPGIVFLIPGITRIEFTVLRWCGIPNSLFINFVLAYS
jgi:hypothetical protein